tara:strand:+ start:16 stop:828 length:813 start_codon:yes stop_codon:yes gene_type:complete
MAVNVNTVYKTVLSILNKEQRGYVTPDEFNRLATQVQLEIFESYFPDGTQLNRQNQNNTQNDTEFFNIFKNQEEKLYNFQQEVSFSYDTATSPFMWRQTGAVNATDYVASIYWMGEILSYYNVDLTNVGEQAIVQSSGGDHITQLVNKKDYNKIIRSKLTAPTQKFPIAFASSTGGTNLNNVGLIISPVPSSVKVNCIVLPSNPSWAFNIGTLGQYVFNAGGAVDFQLHISEQTNIIIGILKYAGVIINDPTIIDVAAQEAAEVQANEKS